MIEDAIAWFVPLAALAAFGSPALVAKHRPGLYRSFFFLLLVAGNFLVVLINGAWVFYRDGYAAALTDTGSAAPGRWLWDINPMLLAGVTVCFWIFLFGVWIYGFIVVKPRL